MKIAFRVDSSFRIGSGHLMRCLTLAAALRERGDDIAFICRAHDGNLVQLIRDNHFDVVQLDSAKGNVPDLTWNDHAEWLGVTQETDAQECADALTGIGRIDWLIVDHYALDCTWQKLMRPFVDKIMVIDDLADRRHDCDLLLDQNLYDNLEHRYDSLVPDNARTLLGPRYALLRPEFRKRHNENVSAPDKIRRILVFFGGTDELGLTMKTLRAVSSINNEFRNAIAVDVVVGASNLNKDEIRVYCESTRWAHYHCQVDNMAELMAAADVSIGAVGATTWERCCLGLPSVVFSVAGNQVEMAQAGARKGLFFYLGNGDSATEEGLRETLSVFVNFPNNLVPYAINSAGVVDGQGCRRVAGFLGDAGVSLRHATSADCDDVYKWRNDAETRQYIFNGEPIPYPEHKSWFESSLRNSERILLIGEESGHSTGVVRFDLCGGGALMSLYLVPELKGQGHGRKLVAAATEWVRDNLPTVKRISAEILPDNVASVHVFENCGFREYFRTYVLDISSGGKD